MHVQGSARSVDGLILRLASRTHGVVSRARLLEAGVSRMEIETRLADGRLKPLHRGVYLVGAVAGEHSYAQAALLACGEGAVLSHRSAAAIWDLRSYPTTAHPWVTIASDRRLERPRIVIRRATLEPRDIRRRSQLAVTSPPRTVLDCAHVIGDAYELESLVADAEYRNLASAAELGDQVKRNARRPGVRQLRAVLDLEGGPRRTRSGGERWFLRLLRENGFEGYEVNAIVAGEEVDFLWRCEKLCVELDGWDAHKGRVAFERDRAKWARLDAAGYDVIPLGVRAAQKDEQATSAQVRAMLQRRQ